MTEEDDRPAPITILHALMHAAQRVLGHGVFASGNPKDEYGGQLYYIYLPPISDDVIIEHLSKRFKTEEEKKVLSDLLPTAKRDFVSDLHSKLRNALEDLTQESLYPIYKATGKRWQKNAIEWNSRNSQKKVQRFVKSELKNGVVRHRVVKRLEAGRPSQWAPEEIEREMKQALKRILKRNSVARLEGEKPEKLTLENVVIEMNKQRDAQTQTTDDAVKQALVRNGLTWKSIKSAVINR
jgi:hypothetical protein